jgi:hypothetical protein
VQFFKTKYGVFWAQQKKKKIEILSSVNSDELDHSIQSARIKKIASELISSFRMRIDLCSVIT